MGIENIASSAMEQFDRAEKLEAELARVKAENERLKLICEQPADPKELKTIQQKRWELYEKLKADRDRLASTLEKYAAQYNWDRDENGTVNVWYYHNGAIGYEPAQKTLAACRTLEGENDDCKTD